MSTATATSITAMFWRPTAALRVATGPEPKRRLPAAALAAICAFTLLFAAAPTSSSIDTGFSESAVATQTDTAGPAVGAQAAPSPATVGGNGPWSYDAMLGCCVAPRAAGSARFVAGSDGVVTDLVGTTPNAVSLGRFPAYVDDAAATGARAFNVGDEWGAMVARTDRLDVRDPEVRSGSETPDSWTTPSPGSAQAASSPERYRT